MREALRLVRPTEFEDMIALVALYRPGPMAYIPVYAKRKNDRSRSPSWTTACGRSRSRPCGLCIYQEQYMEIAKQLAGSSPAEADDLRKAIGKKIHKLMASLKDKFLEGCAANGVTAGRCQSALEGHGAGAGLLLQQVARRLLRADRLSHGVPEGELAGRVHGRADLLGHEHEGPGALLRRGLRRAGDRGRAAGRERLRRGFPRSRGQDPLRPQRREERGGECGPLDPRRARGGRAVRQRSGISASASTRSR